jgi:hypothetical protein
VRKRERGGGKGVRESGCSGRGGWRGARLRTRWLRSTRLAWLRSSRYSRAAVLMSAADIFFTCTAGVSDYGGKPEPASAQFKRLGDAVAPHASAGYGSGWDATGCEGWNLVIHGGEEGLGVIVLVALTETEQVSATRRNQSENLLSSSCNSSPGEELWQGIVAGAKLDTMRVALLLM